MIKIILLLALLALFVYSIIQRKSAFGLPNAMAAICLIGMYFVIYPGAATTVAHFLGVGRGTDLVLYFFVVLVLGVAVNLHLKVRASNEKITEIARAIAVSQAKSPE